MGDGPGNTVVVLMRVVVVVVTWVDEAVGIIVLVTVTVPPGMSPPPLLRRCSNFNLCWAPANKPMKICKRYEIARELVELLFD